MDRKNALQQLVDKAGKGELAFPTGVDVSLRLVQQLDSPDCHVDQAVQLVKASPLLAARIVAVANSAAYCRSGQNVSELRGAIARIGLRTTRTLTVALATRQMAGTPGTPAQRVAAEQLWAHTANVAALAHVIARRVTRCDPETALFAGIIHEIGGFFLISQASDYPELLVGEPADWSEQAEPAVGRAILARLSIPATVSEAVEAVWDGLHSLPPVTLGDTLVLANELAAVSSPLNQYATTSSPDSAPLVDAVIGEATLSSILEESSQEVESLVAALRF